MHIFDKFLRDGKATIRFSDPAHDLCISQVGLIICVGEPCWFFCVGRPVKIKRVSGTREAEPKAA